MYLTKTMGDRVSDMYDFVIIPTNMLANEGILVALHIRLTKANENVPSSTKLMSLVIIIN